jgi:hypothetical protein
VTWRDLLERGLQEDGSIDRDDPAAFELGDLSLEELEAIVSSGSGLDVLLWRLIRESEELREQLASFRRAQELRR